MSMHMHDRIAFVRDRMWMWMQ